MYHASSLEPRPPTQKADISFALYYQEMVHYANMLALGGVFINERYFIDLLVKNSDRSTMGFWLRTWLPTALALIPRKHPLPERFHMCNLYNHIRVKAENDGYGRWVSATPREISSSPGAFPMRSIMDGSMNLHVHAITHATSKPGSCFACGSTDHKISALCPVIKELATNPFAAKAVIQTLQDSIGADAPKTKFIRALLLPSDEDNPSESSPQAEPSPPEQGND
jgi:hypothetical protein